MTVACDAEHSSWVPEGGTEVWLGCGPRFTELSFMSSGDVPKGILDIDENILLTGDWLLVGDILLVLKDDMGDPYTEVGVGSIFEGALGERESSAPVL